MLQEEFSFLKKEILPSVGSNFPRCRKNFSPDERNFPFRFVLFCVIFCVSSVKVRKTLRAFLATTGLYKAYRRAFVMNAITPQRRAQHALSPPRCDFCHRWRSSAMELILTSFLSPILWVIPQGAVHNICSNLHPTDISQVTCRFFISVQDK